MGANATMSSAGLGRKYFANPRSFSGAPASPSTRAVLLDVQLERAPAGMRGQVSALAAPLSSGPTTELRFAALTDVDPWGRPRVAGFGTVPFAVLTTLPD